MSDPDYKEGKGDYYLREGMREREALPISEEMTPRPVWRRFQIRAAMEFLYAETQGCSECGHKHWFPSLGEYGPCPIEDCPCPYSLASDEEKQDAILVLADEELCELEPVLFAEAFSILDESRHG